MRACPSCGVSNAREALFCANCGVALPAACSRCGSSLPDGSRFCPSCGAPVSEAFSPGQERKLATVLFADVTGSTALGERLDAERLDEVMTAYFEAMRRELQAEGATVEKYVGDAVMAVFGVPTSHDDDPTRALRASLRMHTALENLNPRLEQVHGLALAMRIGINMGEVLAETDPLPGERMVTGAAVNVAARLEQAAEPGQILVGERAARASRGFHLVDVGRLTLQGKEEPVHAFELVGEEREQQRASERFGAPMVGRDRECVLLQSVYERVASERRPHLVTIYADAGMGKSRLVGEFEAWAERLTSPPRVVRGRCLPYGEGVTYWPLVEILHQHAGVLHDDPPQLALKKVQKIASEVLSADFSVDPARATAALCFTVGLEQPDASVAELDPRQRRAEIHAAWRLYFTALAIAGPTVVVIEDLHWADAAMLDLLEEVAERAEGPVLFLCPSRPELTGARPGWGGGRRNVSSMVLEPLTTEDARCLVGFLAPGERLPPELRERVMERAGGNPFFLEEIVRHLLDEGGIEEPGSAGKLGAVHIPDTVQGVLAARMDQLPTADKRVLQAAAVVGRVFWVGPLSGLLETERSQLEDSLGRLEERGLVIARLGSSMGGEAEYLFKHILTRDVAYESLPRRDRAAAHAHVASWIEERIGERGHEYGELLAHHYREAYQSVRDHIHPDPDWTESMRRNAFRYSLQSSEDARAKLVLAKAIRFAEDALGLADSPAERAGALEALGEAYFADYQGDLAWPCLREAVDVLVGADHADQGDPRTVARLCAKALEVATRGRGAMRSRLREEEAAPYLAIGLSHVGEDEGEEKARLLIVKSFWPYSFRDSASMGLGVKEAREAGERAAEMALRLGRPDLASAALDGVASSYVALGLYGPMQPVVERRLELAPSLSDPAEVGDIFAVAAWCAFHVGRYRDAFDLADRGFRRARDEAAGMALHCLDWRALARCRLGDWDGFFGDAALAEELLGDRRENPPGFASDHLAAAAYVREVRGETEEADRLLRVLAWLERAEERPSPGWAVWRALLLARRGRFEDGRGHLERAELLAPYGLGYVLSARCDLAAEQGTWDESPALEDQARRHAEQAGLLALPLHADRLQGRRLLAKGDPAAAIDALDRARAGFEGLEAGWDAACTALCLGQALTVAGRADDARSALSGAAPAFDRLGAVKESDTVRRLLEEAG